MKQKVFSSSKGRTKFLIALGLLVIVLLSFAYFGKPLFNFFKNPEKIKIFVLSFGAYSPFVLILLQILQVLIAPIPGQLAGFISGFIFGAVLGTLYSMIGTIAGSAIAFVLSRALGRPFVEKVIDKGIIKKFDYVSKKNGTFALFLIYLLPALPDDAISFMAGLTKIPIRNLIFITFLGRFPGMLILNMIGSGVANSKTGFSIILLLSLMAMSFFIYINRKKVEKIAIKLVSKFRNYNN